MNVGQCVTGEQHAVMWQMQRQTARGMSRDIEDFGAAWISPPRHERREPWPPTKSCRWPPTARTSFRFVERSTDHQLQQHVWEKSISSSKRGGGPAKLPPGSLGWPVSVRDVMINAMTTHSVQRLGVPFVQGEC
ncbi:hypothetical protein LTT66_30840 [Nocardia gipuzkoensis]|uniref:hypothetical protein n=1 Tax=Nocardia gipuzkoensis TaxID=2749991 RepID=UPI001E621CA4|nr:hypothetical protein [Nocardia gipuzkoensis]UGT67562.1 hypothetical protein LTT66_30840 [Nocardia gipuzkoensis]